MKTEFDVVIPVHEKDLLTLDYVIDGIRKNIAGCRRIITVSKVKLTDKAEWFDESLYPFSFQEVSNIVQGKRVGWHYQQLLKFYAALVIPDISENVLIVDADTVFYRKVEFFSQDGLPLYNLSKDKDLESSSFQQGFISHISTILPTIESLLPKEFKSVSGVCHHMLFQKSVILDLMKKIEDADFGGRKFHEILLKNDDKNSFVVSEYNLYFYFLVCFYPNRYKIRILNYKNTAKFRPWFERLRKKYHYCSYHSYMRE